MALALTNARIFTATGGPVLEGGTAIVDDGAITWVGPTSEAPIGAAAVVDCSGKTILPGFVDAHAHLVYHDLHSVHDIDLARPLEQAAIDAVLNASKLLRIGITSIRDVGTRGNIAVLVRQAVNEGRLPGPRIRAAKQIISVWGGLVDWHPSHIFGRKHYAGALADFISGPWEARDAVRQQVKDGVDWIKVEASGTGANPFCPGDRDTMSAEELAAVIDEATEKGKPVACHAESRNSIIRAAGLGARTIEHAIYLDEEGLEAVLTNDVAICPTLASYRAFATKGLEVGVPPAVVAAHRSTHSRHVEAIRRAYEAGVTLIAGSDAGGAKFPHGENLEEVCVYVELVGMSEEDALLTATRNAAHVIGVGHEVGTLEPGKRADLVILSANPLERIRTIMEPDALAAVLQDGEVVAGRLPGRDGEGQRGLLEARSRARPLVPLDSERP